MSDCRKIESMLYLYREGELSVSENARVSEHVKTCLRCQSILDELRSMDYALAELRRQAPQAEMRPDIVTDTLQRIAGESDRVNTRKYSSSLLDAFLGFLRPALSAGLIVAGLLFIGQESRDALKLVELERRLQMRGDLAVTEVTQQNDLPSLEELSSLKPSAAAIAGDPSAFFGSGLTDFFRHNPGLFEELSRRYPHLSSITLDDGLDERERAVLATEGKALVQEFEQLIRKGER